MHPVLRPRVVPPRSFTRLAVHAVWTTREREPLLEPRVDEWLATSLFSLARTLGCELLAAGNTSDHVHVLIAHPPTVTVSDLVQRLKGSVSHEWNRRALLERRLEWQAGYWAETCDPNELEVIAHRLLAQRVRHATSTELEPWERALDRAEG